MGYNMTDNMVDSVFAVLGLNFPLLAEMSLFSTLPVTVIVLILNITINTSEKSCSIFFFSVCSCTIFFLNVKCLLDIFWGFYPPPDQKSNGPSLRYYKLFRARFPPKF